MRRDWRRWFTHRDRNRCSPVLPGGGGAKAGRVSVERLTAGTDRSATGISEDCLEASSRTPEAVVTLHHAPPLVRGSNTKCSRVCSK